MASSPAVLIPLLVLSVVASVVPTPAGGDTASGAGRDRGASSPGLRTGTAALAGAAEPASPGSPDTTADLGPTSAAPWNPPEPAADAEPWEIAVRMPGRIISLPLSGLGYLARHQLLRSEVANHVPQVRYFLMKTARYGFAVTSANLGDRTGFGAALKLSPASLGHVVSARWEGSTRGYDRTRFALALGPLSASYGYEWRPRERFYGLGLQSSENMASTYAAQSEDVRLSLELPGRRAGEAPPRARAGLWIGPRRMVVRAGREAPSFEGQFQSLAAAQLDTPLEHLAYGGRVALDRRSGRPHWSRGFRLAAEVTRFDRPVRGLALHDARGPVVQFTRYTLEAEGGFSLMRDPRTIRLALRAEDNRPGAGGAVLLEDLAKLGGARGLSGFEPGRFHDLGALVGRLSYIFPLAMHFEFDIHAEAGGVYPDIWKDARPKRFKHSYGVALRPRNSSAPLGAVGVDWSAEAVRLRYSIGGVQ